MFNTNLRVLPLSSYDGILGLDWLAMHSPMQIDWVQKWMSFTHQGQVITLQGLLPEDVDVTVFSVTLLQPTTKSQHHPEL